MTSKQRQLSLLGQQWYKRGKRGEVARLLLAEHPRLFRSIKR